MGRYQLAARPLAAIRSVVLALIARHASQYRRRLTIEFRAADAIGT
jgi:hypothetical protein